MLFVGLYVLHELTTMDVGFCFSFCRFKNNGDNFHVKLPAREKLIIPNISVPEELVQVQAYLRWERNGKQMYTPEQEKVSVKSFISFTGEIVEEKCGFICGWIDITNFISSPLCYM